MPTVLERLKQDLAELEEMGRGDGPLAKQLRAQIEASEAFPNSSAEQLYRVTPIQMSKDETQDEEPPQEDEPLSEEETEIYLKMQDKIDQYLIEVGAVSPQAMESLEKVRSATSDDTTPDNRESR